MEQGGPHAGINLNHNALYQTPDSCLPDLLVGRESRQPERGWQGAHTRGLFGSW